MLAFGVQSIASVPATPVAVAEFTLPAVTVWHAPEEIEDVANANEPLATVAGVAHIV
jgi:hypothetical protein